MKNQAILFILSIDVSILPCRHQLQRSTPVARALPWEGTPVWTY